MALIQPNELKKLREKINKTFEEATVEVLNEVGKETVKFMQDYIDKNWYQTFTPKVYERTNAFRDSITYTLIRNPNSDTQRIMVYWSMEQLKAIHREKTWSAHQSFGTNGSIGEDFTYGLIEWIDNGGFEGGVQTNPRRLDGGIKITEATDRFLNDYLNKEVQKRIRLSIRSAVGKAKILRGR